MIGSRSFLLQGGLPAFGGTEAYVPSAAPGAIRGGVRGLNGKQSNAFVLVERMTMENIRVRLMLEGRVQGVWFRESTRQEAQRLGVHGWVRNRREGTVEVLAEGPLENVRKLVAWCHHGPPAARVTRVHETAENFQGEFVSFDVVYSH
jgi:acylphosphatase